MSAISQIAQGNINKKATLPQGSLFWNSANENTQYADRPWDEGTLYVYGPHTNSGDLTPVPIGGVRANQAVVYRGELSAESSIADTIFQHARKGDMYVWANDAASGIFHTTDDFRQHDILLITSATVAATTGLSTDIVYERINCSGGWADDVYYDGVDSDLSARDVSSAIKELELEKLSYRGTLATQQAIAELALERGTMYLCITDGLTFSTADATFTVKKGDFVYYRNSNLKWQRIPSGYTDDSDIDVHEAAEISAGMNSTFTNTHKNEVAAVTNVAEALKLLFQKKAQLDEEGKIPLSQLHGTVLGAMQYKGVWSPVITGTAEDGINLPANQNGFPGSKAPDSETGTDVSTETPQPGDYWIVQVNGFTSSKFLNVQYKDKTSLQADGTYSRVLELNNGDWIVYQAGTEVETGTTTGYWTKIDNTDALACLKFLINGQYSGDDIDLVVTTELDLVGTPTFEAAEKIALVNDSGKVLIGGVRLVSEMKGEDGVENYIPRYAGAERNSLKNSHIEDADEVVVHTTFNVGKKDETYDANVHGEITLFPHSAYNKENGLYEYSTSGVNWWVWSWADVPYESTETYTEDVAYTKSTITIDTSAKTITIGASDDINSIGTFLEFKTAFASNADITAILNGIALDDSAIVTFEAQTLSQKRVAVFKSGSTDILGEYLSDLGVAFIGYGTDHTALESTVVGTFTVTSTKTVEKTRAVTLYKKELQENMATLKPQETFTADMTAYLPNQTSTIIAKLPGVVFTSARILKSTTDGYAESTSIEEHMVDGKPSAVEIHTNLTVVKQYTRQIVFGEKGTTEFGDATSIDEKVVNLVESDSQTSKEITVYLPPASGTLATVEDLARSFNGTKDTLPVFGEAETVDGIKHSTLVDSTVKQTIGNLFKALSTSKGYSADTADTEIVKESTDKEVEVGSDTIIGSVADDGAITPKALLVTKFLALGNSKTNRTYVVPGRTRYPDAPQYKNPYTGEAIAEDDVIVEPPSVGGVLLTSNSVIDCGVYL